VCKDSEEVRREGFALDRGVAVHVGSGAAVLVAWVHGVPEVVLLEPQPHRKAGHNVLDHLVALPHELQHAFPVTSLR